MSLYKILSIVPVALYDSYQVFNSSHLGPVTTYVDYLEPIPSEELLLNTSLEQQAGWK